MISPCIVSASKECLTHLYKRISFIYFTKRFMSYITCTKHTYQTLLKKRKICCLKYNIDLWNIQQNQGLGKWQPADNDFKLPRKRTPIAHQIEYSSPTSTIFYFFFLFWAIRSKCATAKASTSHLNFLVSTSDFNKIFMGQELFPHGSLKKKKKEKNLGPLTRVRHYCKH